MKHHGYTFTPEKRYVGHGTVEAFGPISKGGHGKAKPKTSGHMNPWDLKTTGGHKHKD